MRRSSTKPRQRMLHVLLGLIVLWNVWMVFHAMNPVIKEKDRLVSVFEKSRSIQSRDNERQRSHRHTSVNVSRHRREPNLTSCVKIECIEQKAQALSRSFIRSQNRTWRSLPLLALDGGEEEEQRYLHHGLIYVKVPITGSSTIAGAALRIAKTYHVQVHYDHSSGQEYNSKRRSPMHSFLFASIRDPAERALSFLAYEASRTQKHYAMTQTTLLQSLRSMHRLGVVQKSEGRGGIQLAFTSLYEIPKHSAWKPGFPEYVVRSDRVEEHVQHVLDNNDFLILTERMDESLVALAMLLDVSIKDVLVFSSKIASRSTTIGPERLHIIGDGRFLPIRNPTEGMVCVPLRHIPKELLSDAHLQSYLQSDEWHAMNYGDYVLHRAVNASLDKTIRELGYERFDSYLQDYRRLVTRASTFCGGKAFGPCSTNGTLQLKAASKNCYVGDYGCGYGCIDEMLNQSFS